jgi:hypothetical protein
VIRSRFAVVVLGLILAGSAGGSVAQAHTTGADHPTWLEQWYLGASLPSSWYDAVINGALVWDNVTGQCHDFQRVSSGVLAMRDPNDGAGGTYAYVTSDHTVIHFDSTETWHLNINVQNGSSSLDLWGIAAHEFGHVLHLWHSASNNGDTMQPGVSYADSWTQRTLTANDQFRERSIYPGC